MVEQYIKRSKITFYGGYGVKMFDWLEYYSFAKKQLLRADSLCEDEAPQKEAMLRSAGSRAYYAAYHRACDYLREVKNYPTNQAIQAAGKSSHQLVIDKFINDTSHPEWKELGMMLQRLKDFRHWADYEAYGTHVFTDTSKIAKRVDLAEEIIRRIDSLEGHVSGGN
jgi:hypothetical protein